jgi:hypothetical protein
VLSPGDRRLLDALTGYGQARGWAESTLVRARRSVTTLLTSSGDLGEPPWEAASVRRFLAARHLTALRAIEFLADQGQIGGTGNTVLEQWLAGRLAGLPGPIAAEVRIWAGALQGRGPRPARPRQAATLQGYLRAMQAPLASWATSYQSLRQVTTGDVAAQLVPLTGATRLLTLSAMRSLFTTLKARRVLFTNPAAPLTGPALQPPPVLALDPARRAGLLGRLHRPGERLIVLLAGMHALRPSQISALALDDARPADGTLLVHGRARRLDRLTANYLRGWLGDRHARWPATANLYLLINKATAGGVRPVTRSYILDITRRAGITARELRADRLLDEAHASGGDPLKLTHLFGISDPHRPPLLRRGRPAGRGRRQHTSRHEVGDPSRPIGSRTDIPAVHIPLAARCGRYRDQSGRRPAGPEGQTGSVHPPRPRCRTRGGAAPTAALVWPGMGRHLPRPPVPRHGR